MPVIPALRRALTWVVEKRASHSSCEEGAYLGGCTVVVGQEFLVKKMCETRQLEKRASHSSCEEGAYLGGCTEVVG